MTDTALQIATDFIAEREGFRSYPYQDSAGVWTQGYGFTYLPNGEKVTHTTPPIPQPTAKKRLGEMVASVLANVRKLITAKVTDHAAAACTSLCYNVGTVAFKNSTLLKKLNAGDMDGAEEQFGAWVYAANRVNQGLVNRRELEKDLFQAPDAPPPAAQAVPKPVEVAAITHAALPMPVPSDPVEVQPPPRVEDEADLLNAAEFVIVKNKGV